MPPSLSRARPRSSELGLASPANAALKHRARHSRQPVGTRVQWDIWRSTQHSHGSHRRNYLLKLSGLVAVFFEWHSLELFGSVCIPMPTKVATNPEHPTTMAGWTCRLLSVYRIAASALRGGSLPVAFACAAYEGAKAADVDGQTYSSVIIGVFRQAPYGVATCR